MADQSTNIWLSDYQSVEHAGPDDDMTLELYASFLERRGVTVMIIVNRVCEEFSMGVSEAWRVVRRTLEAHGTAHLREVELIAGLRRHPDDHALARKVVGNLGLELAEALNLVEAYRSSKT